ncbi:hypothetical protein NB568_13215 [Vibrio alginolyticus]|uniref:hypothetical protein n=1 Tax=Vibrio TaxID=662 RepID=UPI000CE9758A|nr:MULTISPECIES: hypothetical protein [Vibrio]MDW2293693.1 hypothetical protein [Vibrio sp. 1404]AVF73642.1 hypothetical protein AL539_07815 [Vibrio alginolyticus]EGQ8496647.1 hypothetical protein [Vibrio alginolyticus]EGR0024884.1 hypothetical protein [Vibrio alginolyticus]ELB2830173.1 hypothetical protein [Vibrio alginolyticus]
MSEYHNVLILGKSMRLLLRALLIEIQANKEWVIAQKSGGKAVKRRKLLELSQSPFLMKRLIDLNTPIFHISKSTNTNLKLAIKSFNIDKYINSLGAEEISVYCA